VKKINIFIKKLINLFKIVIFADYSFTYPPKKKVLLFDDNLEIFLRKYIPVSNYTILFSRHKKYNFLILIKLLIQFKLSSLNYFNEFINHVKPKIIITFTDNSQIFYKIKPSHGSKKIFIQAGYRTATREDVFYHTNFLKKQKSLNFVDYMFVFNKRIGQEYKKFINGDIKEIGSFRSNFFKISKAKKKYDILFISVWRDELPNHMQTDTVSRNTINTAQTKLLIHLKNYCLKNNRHITIYGKYYNKHESLKEREFFSKILQGTKWNFLTNDRMKTYKFCDEAKLIVSTNSTLGYEALGRGSKVAIFNIMNFDKSTKSKNFCWPYKIEKKGPFWTSTLSQNSCNELIDKLSNFKKNNWNKNNLKNMKKVLSYNENNIKFSSLIKKLIN
tara:strand:+ start:944 stop:2107 length:1164 start_codon:yes stop_codon:yes gene_type:complete